MKCLSVGSIRIGLEGTPQILIDYAYDQYSEYLSEGEPDFLVVFHWKNLDPASVDTDQSIMQAPTFFYHNVFTIKSSHHYGTIDAEQKNAVLTFKSARPMVDIEYFLRIVLSFAFFNHGGFVIHASGIVRENKAYIFFGKSGAGKTTVARLSEQYHILSDDLVGIMPGEDGVSAHSTPFWNTGWERHPKLAAEVIGFYKLIQDDRVWIEKIRLSQSIADLLTNIPILPAEEKLCLKLISRLEDVIRKVDISFLHFTPDVSFWDQLL